MAADKFEAPKLTRRLSQVERDALTQALQEIKAVKQRLVEGGLSPLTFFVGLVTLCVSAFLLGKCPEHFWVVYSTQCVFILATRVNLGKVDNTLLYFLDFCWVMNFFYACVSVVMMLDAFTQHNFFHPASRHPELGVAVFVIACGPLALSVPAMANALVLHDIRNYSAAFIHMFPCVTCYTLKWHGDAVAAAWPGTFDSFRFTPMEAELSWFDMWKNAAVVYGVWWVLFAVWMVVHGRFQSKETTGMSTVYEFNVRRNKAVSAVLGIKDPEKDFPRVVNVLKYMAMHAVLVLGGFLNGVACAKSWHWHTFICTFIVLTAMWNGAQRYYKIMTRFYVKKIEALVAKYEHKDE